MTCRSGPTRSRPGIGNRATGHLLIGLNSTGAKLNQVKTLQITSGPKIKHSSSFSFREISYLRKSLSPPLALIIRKCLRTKGEYLLFTEKNGRKKKNKRTENRARQKPPVRIEMNSQVKVERKWNIKEWFVSRFRFPPVLISARPQIQLRR